MRTVRENLNQNFNLEAKREKVMTSFGKIAIGILTIGLIAIAPAFTSDANAQKKSRVQIGMLTCTVAGGVGLIFTSKKNMTCIFKKRDGTEEKYTGHVRKIGIDIGFTGQSHIEWAVLAPSKKIAEKALEGRFVGVSGEVSMIGGVGGNILIGGFKKSFTLQPFSVQSQVGVNIAGGIGGMRLKYVDQ